jgi:hypothetical protein
LNGSISNIVQNRGDLLIAPRGKAKGLNAGGSLMKKLKAVQRAREMFEAKFA